MANTWYKNSILLSLYISLDLNLTEISEIYETQQ